MSPESEFIKNLWAIVQEIKTIDLDSPRTLPEQKATKDISFVYSGKPHIIAAKILSIAYITNLPEVNHHRRTMVYKLEEWKTLHVLGKEEEDFFDHDGSRVLVRIIRFQLIQPRFAQLYKLLKHAFKQQLDLDYLYELAVEWNHPVHADSHPITRDVWLALEGKELDSDRAKKASRAGKDKKEINFQNPSYEEAIFILRILINKLINILEIYCKQPIFLKDLTLNYYYTILKNDAETIFNLSLQELNELKGSYPELPESLIGHTEEMDMYWEYGGQQSAYEFQGKVEKASILTKKSFDDYSLPDIVKQNLEKADVAIDVYANAVKKIWTKHLQAIDEKFRPLKEQLASSEINEHIDEKATIQTSGEGAKKTRQDHLQKRNRPAFSTESDESPIKYYLKRTKNGRIVLNDVYLIASPKFSGSKDQLCEFIFNNPNKKLKKNEISKEIKIDITRNWHQLLDDLNLRGEMRKLFFNISEEILYFRNEVTEEELAEFGIDPEKLALEIKKLKPWGASRKPSETSGDTRV